MTTTTRTPADTMTAYFDAWRRHDAESLRDVLADDVVFDGPMGHVEGLEDNVAALHGLLGIVTDVAIRTVFVDGPDVLTVYDLHTTEAEPILTVNWAHVVDGRATTIRAVFDPRPLVG
jgi:ketosteroid isomerase-like protein